MSLVIIISGPAGSGKNTVSERLIADFPNTLERVVTSTSRAPRGAEKNGTDYHFLSAADFERGIDNGEFYEHAKVHGNYYGTSKSALDDPAKRGRDLILIIDVQGARAWRKIAEVNAALKTRMLSVFIRPPSVCELRNRLRIRATESECDIERRMKTAEEELKYDSEFDFVIDSKSKDEDFAALKKIYTDRKRADGFSA